MSDTMVDADEAMADMLDQKNNKEEEYKSDKVKARSSGDFIKVEELQVGL